jgi:hypothetical protein
MTSAKVAFIASLVWLALITMPAEGIGAQPANAQPVASLQPKVVGVEGNLEADDLIRVDIDHLADWAAANNPAKLVPYLNGLAIRGCYPEEIHTLKNHLQFHLQIAPENKQVWVDLLGAPKGMRKLVTVSVGLENQSAFDTVYDDSNRFPLTVISRWYGFVALVVVVVTLIFFLWLARSTNIIREPGPQPVGGKHRPYNLGRTQMAFWFFMIYASYVVIWLITSALDPITGSVLALMGISAGTALSEALIDSGKGEATASNLNELAAEKQTLEQSIPNLEKRIDGLEAKAAMTPEDLANRDSLSKRLQDYRTRLTNVKEQILVLTPDEEDDVSAGFLRDILSDGHGYSFHRFQIFAWTIVLGIMFVSSVYNGLAMPEFSPTLLGLMGISSGTYIGFKFPEQKQAAN